jgi:hypothetical protein
MLNYQSVRSSEPQIRSNPALRHISSKSGFQAKLVSLLELTQLPFPTFQILKDASESTLTTNQFYAWVRPKQLRAQWLVLSDGFPLTLIDPKDSKRMNSIRIPFDKNKVQKLGPIICEAAWDPQDHILWIFDVVFWEKQAVWSYLPYSKRWDLVKQVVGSILDCGHPMSDAEVQVPTWQSLVDIATKQEEFDPAFSVEFQPERAGQRRHLWLIPDTRIKFKPLNHHERKMVAEALPKRMPLHEKPLPVEKLSPVIEPVAQPTKLEQHPTIAYLSKDTASRVPDIYQLSSSTGKSLGLAAIRSLGISKALREALKTKERVLVDIEWYEPFQKYSIKQIRSE